jgi:hypothetical protein
VQLALEEIRDTLAKYDEQSAERLRNAVADGTVDAGAVPGLKQPELVTAFLAESLATLAKIVDEQLQKRPRGRPPKRKSA